MSIIHKFSFLDLMRDHYGLQVLNCDIPYHIKDKIEKGSLHTYGIGGERWFTKEYRFLHPVFEWSWDKKIYHKMMIEPITKEIITVRSVLFCGDTEYGYKQNSNAMIEKLKTAIEESRLKEKQ